MKRVLLLSVALLFFASHASAQAPTIFFTDLSSGTNSGGETVSGFSGAYVTVYGNYFGTSQGSSTITWNGLNCLRVVQWGTAQLWYQKIVVQLGSSCAVGSGNFVVTVNGVANTIAAAGQSQFTVRSTGSIFCVSTTGNDSNSGAFPASCWASVFKASQAMNAGDTTYVLNGVVDNAIRGFSATIPLSKGGSIGLPIAYVVYPGATATVGDITNSQFAIRTPNIGISANYLVFAGFNIRGQMGIEMSQSNDHNWFIANDFSCSGTSGFSCLHVDISTNIYTYGNYLHDNATNCSVNAGNPTGAPCKFHGFYYTTNTNHVWVGWNDLNPNGSHIATGNSGGCNGIQFFSTGGADQFDLHVHDNKIRNVICGGLTFSSVNPDLGTVEAYNNVFTHDGTGPDPSGSLSNYACINVGTGTANIVSPVLIYNNSFYDCGARGVADNSNAAVTIGSTTPIKFRVQNNTIQLTGSTEQYILFPGGATCAGQVTGDHNSWFGNGSIPCPTQLAGDLNVNPLYTSTTLDAWDLRPQTTSPLLRVGTTSPVPTFDYTGLTRPTAPAIGAIDSSPMGPLVQSTNTNYFKTPAGKTITLNGSHTWNAMQDTDTSAPGSTTFQPLDYNAYLANLVAWGHNATILWHKDLPHYCSWTGGGGGDWTMGPWQWKRTGPGNATDGGLKFDLTQLDQAFFDRLRTRVIAAQQSGIYAIVELFDGLGLVANRCSTDGFPFTVANNINAIDDGGGASQTSMTMGSTNAITAIQEAYVKKVIDTVNDLPNVIYEPEEEGPNGLTTFWGPFMIDLIHKYEAGGTLTQTGEVFTAKPFQHPVLYATPQNLTSDNTLYNSNAEMVAPGARQSPTTSCGSGSPACKVNVNDSDHTYFGIWTDSQLAQRQYIWNNITNGDGVVFMDPYVIFNSGGARNNCASPVLGVCATPVTTVGSYQMNLRNNMGYANSYLNGRMNLTNDHPASSLSSTGHVLANNAATGFEFLVYAPNGGAFTVNLSVQNGNTMSCEWLNPSSGAVTSCGTYTATSSTAQNFTTPFSGDSVLFLKAQSLTPTASLSPSSVAFGNQIVATSSAPTSITLTNNGTAALGITSIAFTGTNLGDFSISSNNCGATLSQGSSCVVGIAFSPTAVGSRSANLTFTTNAATSPDNVTLTGTGTQTDIYLAQAAAGAGDGITCARARAVSFFNASGNWGTTPGQIGSGVTVHLCGTIASTLIAPASQGTGLITIKFESGASLQQPAAQSLIQITNKTNSYLITGTAPCGFINHVAIACTEKIQNTANGSPSGFANTVTNVVGMDFSGTTGAVTVQWLELGNLYQHTDPNDSAFTDGAKLARGIADDIMMGNLTMQQMVIHDTSWALAPNPRQVSAANPPVFTVANVEFYNNDHDIALGSACNPSCWSVVIHDNHSHAHNAWNTFANAYHHDGIHTFNEQRQASSVTVYNNLFEGPWDWNSTDPIFDQSALQNFSLFNNVFICTAACTGSPAALRQYGGGPNEFQANNTFIQSGIPRTGTVLYITVTTGGSGYTSSPTVTVAGSATATAAVSGGAVTQLTVTNPGSGYQFPPAVSFSGGGGSGATATASIGFSNGSGVELTVPAGLPLASSNVTSMNNIVSGASQCFNFNSQVFAANTATSGLDYNICANYITSGNRAFNWNGTSTDLFNTWQTLSGEGIHSQMVGNGLLGADGTPQSGSPAIGSGTNLTSLCVGNLAPLCSDYNGLARPSSGSWNVGAIGNPPTGGTPLAALSQTSAAFFNQMVGTTTSIPIVVTLSNNGTAVLSITSLTLTGANPTNFGQSNTCGSGIAAGTSCLITITFSPSALGPRSAILNVNDNASGSPHTVSLTGNGMKTISGTGTITGTGTVKVQ